MPLPPPKPSDQPPNTGAEALAHTVADTSAAEPAAQSPANHATISSPGAPASPSIYGSFWLDTTEFALQAGVIKEVVNDPDGISAMPMSPPYMLGLFNLRGRIIPIVDLRRLLKHPEIETAERKVAIIDDGDVCIGLRVDGTGEVLNIKTAARVDLRPRQGGVEDLVVEGLLKLDDGKRIVQILDPYEILSLKKIPRGETSARNLSNPAPARGGRLSCLSFQMGHTTCAIDLRYVIEVMENPEIIDSVLVNDCFIGITNLRGRIIPVADFRNFMGDSADIRDSGSNMRKRKMLIVQTDGGLIGLLVYSIDSILSYFRDDILQFTKLALPRADIVRGCLVGKEKEIVMLLDHEVLRTDRVLVETARRCQEVHPPEDTAKTADQTKAAGPRLTFIVFAFSKNFALDTSLVSEVVIYPETLLKPPYALDFVEGIMNLRGELITLINPRVLYGMPSDQQRGERVLIFKHEGRKYGILVDAVTEIVTTTQNKVTEQLAITHGAGSVKIAEDTRGCIKSPTQGPVMILDINAVLQRCFKRAGGRSLDPAPAT